MDAANADVVAGDNYHRVLRDCRRSRDELAMRAAIGIMYSVVVGGIVARIGTPLCNDRITA